MISRQDIINIRADVQNAITDIGKKYGVMISVGRGKYGTTGELKLEISKVNADGVAETQQLKDFKRYAVMFGLKPEDLHETFVSHGKRFKITGLNVKAQKNHIIAEHDGKEYVFPGETVARLLEKKS